MKLQLFRNHLAAELKNLPDTKSQEIQSYVLTTSILIRRIIEDLDIKAFKIPERHVSYEKHADLSEIVNIFIHYIRFSPYPPFQDDPSSPTDCIVKLYSERSSKRRGRFFHIDLKDYFEAATKIANDDLFIADHLLRRVTTLLAQTINTKKEFDDDYLANIFAIMVDAIDLCIKLNDADKLAIPDSRVDEVYELKFRNMQEKEYIKSCYFSGCKDFIRGFRVDWSFSPFIPSRESPGDRENPERVYCIHIETREQKIVLVTFNSLLNIFSKIRKSLP